MNIKPFSQAGLVPRLRPQFVRRNYVRLLATNPWFRFVNRRYIRALGNITGVPPIGAAGSRVLADLRRDGLAFAHIDEFVPHKGFARLQEHFYDLLRQHEAQPADGKAGTKPYIVRLGGDCVLRSGDDPVTKMVANGEFAAIAGAYMGMVPRFSGTRLWHTIPIDNVDRIASQQWHRDYNDQLFLKVFLYLNDVDQRSGPLEFIRGTHRSGPHGGVLAEHVNSRGTRDYVSDGQIAAHRERLEACQTACVGPAGTLVFVDTFGFHRGGKCVDRCRDVFIMHYNTNANISAGEYTADDGFERFDSPFMNMVFGLQ